jgi:hypothetical protein
LEQSHTLLHYSIFISNAVQWWYRK